MKNRPLVTSCIRVILQNTYVSWSTTGPVSPFPLHFPTISSSPNSLSSLPFPAFANSCKHPIISFMQFQNAIASASYSLESYNLVTMTPVTLQGVQVVSFSLCPPWVAFPQDKWSGDAPPLVVTGVPSLHCSSDPCWVAMYADRLVKPFESQVQQFESQRLHTCGFRVYLQWALKLVGDVKMDRVPWKTGELPAGRKREVFAWKPGMPPPRSGF